MKQKDKNLFEIYQSIGSVKNDFRNQNLYQLIISKLAGKSVLDVGAGAGHFLNAAKEKGFEVRGIEFNSDLINLSQELYKKDLNISKGTAEDSVTNHNATDNITMIDVLEHIEQDGSVLQKVKEKLGDKGQLIIVVPAYQFLYGKRDKSIGHFRRYSPKSLKKTVEENGFDVISLRSWNLIGIIPYLYSEKVLKKDLKTHFRHKSENLMASFFNRLLFYWFRYIENQINFGLGLSVLCVAVPKKN